MISRVGKGAIGILLWAVSAYGQVLTFEHVERLSDSAVVFSTAFSSQQYVYCWINWRVVNSEVNHFTRVPLDSVAGDQYYF
ncbi:MAG TPA: hypothetical protein VL633_03230, partial [Bacteroidota bacterium]|nr:hypothetical protein [Bacteroidota bacterium]